MADYTPASRLFTPNGAVRGTGPIRELFVTMFSEFAKPGMSFEMLRQDIDGDTAYIVWKAETAANRYELGTDTFVVKKKSGPRRSQGRSRRSIDQLDELLVDQHVRLSKDVSVFF